MARRLDGNTQKYLPQSRHLGTAGATSVTLDILDEKGELVRRYSSADKLPELSREERRLAPEWLEPPVVLPATPGMHRFVWPLRYPAPPALGACEEADRDRDEAEQPRRGAKKMGPQ